MSRVRRIGDTITRYRLSLANNSIMHTHSIYHKEEYHLIISTIDGFLFCLFPKNPEKETFHSNFLFPICHCLFIPETKSLYCGDVTGQVHLFCNFPANKFSALLSIGPQTLQAIDNFVVGMYFDDSNVVSLQHNRQVKCWKTT